MNKSIYLIGVGNYTEVIIELAIDCGYSIEGLYHYNTDRLGEKILNIEIIGTTDDLFKRDITNQNFAVTIGDNIRRTSIADKIRKAGGKTPSLIHPKATISASSNIGVGCFIHHGAFVWTRSNIANDCILSPFAHVAHHTTVKNGCFITSFSIVGAYSTLNQYVFMGLNSVITPNKIIGQGVTIGAKANIITDCEPDSTMIGNPAKKLKK